mgnify:CR=1 FL=1
MCSELLPLETSAEKLRAGGYVGVIISGGPSSVYDDEAPKPHPDLFELGMCLVHDRCKSRVSFGS